MATDIDRQEPAPAPDGRTIWRLGLKLFLLSLAVFFAASLVVYIVTASSRPPPMTASEANELPWMMWVSTAVLIIAGVSVETAAQRAKRARLEDAGAWLMGTAALGLLFVITQTVAISQLIGLHELERARPILGLAGLTFVLILIHALHVIGGMVPLGLLVRRARREGLSLEHIPKVRGIAIYWHFLELVWFTMLFVFWFTAPTPVG